MLPLRQYRKFQRDRFCCPHCQRREFHQRLVGWG
ncbi:hypothetical protein CY0110_18457 [Crocosphaera chwakensis CCY0110]|uniref:Uncharacterized protein n=1 Tax=Crocosphaera chwakensis CCY0110 TaxID=391612 RepID=A3IJ23_9CHRO|nr:hypothetical protein CY0110_18457 [Crocosphaera chwakensis CCY0110]